MSLDDRLARLQGWVVPASPVMPPTSPAYERLLLLVNHARTRLDYEEREDSAATDGRLEPVEEPEPEPEPSALDLQKKLISNPPSTFWSTWTARGA